MTRYSRRFYTSIRQGSRQSAIEVVPLLLDWVAPRSVIDVGCGVGTWLSVFRELGVEQVWGVDGPWVDRKLLEIRSEEHTSELQSHSDIVCRLLREKKK